MFNVHHSKQTLWDNNVEGFVFLLKQDFDPTADLRRIESEYYPHLFDVLKRHKFTGKKGQSFVLTARKDDHLIQIFFYGLGPCDGLWHKELENLRRTLGSCMLHVKRREVHTSAVVLPPATLFGVDRAQVAKQMTIAAHYASYEFTTFRSVKKEKKWKHDLYIVDTTTSGTSVKKGITQGNIIGDSANESRELINLPGNVATPTYLSKHAKKIAQNNNLTCTVFGRAKATKLGMGGFCAVDAGSAQDGKFVVLEYNSGLKTAPTIAFVGKGITFDTGGISLKPSRAMKGMKYDMSGAAAVMGAMNAIAQLKPKVNVVGITPCVENMPGGSAGRQDDIITFMNGVTAEINSTDAEGRLVLADALVYAEKNYKPDVIIDAATLTGAMVHCLGHYFSGLMTHDDTFADKLEQAGHVSGDRVWRLPLDEDFKKAIESDIADIDNCGKPAYGAGSITAGWFLRHFVDKTPWVHLDIAGTADGVPGVSYLGSGGTAASMRLFVEFVQNYKK